MPAYLLEPATPSASMPDYTSSITNITNELNDIDTDTTSIAAQILLVASSLATIASNSTNIKNSLASIENSLTGGSTTVISVLSAMEEHSRKMKELGDTTGIKIRSPFEAFGMVSIYKLLVEEAAVLQLEKVPDAKKDEALKTIKYYIDRINASQFKEF